MDCHDCSWHHDDAPYWAHTLNHNIVTIGKELNTIMATFADLTTAVATLQDTVNRVAADLGKLDPEDQAALDSAVQALTDANTTLTTADPAPADQPPVV